MKVVVASKNPVKVEATKQAFETSFPGANLEMIPVNVESGVADQPLSDDETRCGSRNRVLAARQAQPDANYWVGLEGGIEVIDDQLMAFAWMAVQGSSETMGEARSVTLPLPPAVKELLDDGFELGDANDRVFSTVNSKQGGGAYGLLTEGLYTRESVYTQTLIIALIPFVNALYPQSNTD